MPIITRIAAMLATAGALVLAAPILPASVTQAGAQERVQISEEFRVALEPYGEFRRHPRWGEVWVPTHVSRDWRPYTVGHWVNSEDYGWYWLSDESEADWGWIAFHYGRWIFDRDLGWAWVPGRVWGPAFVTWRRGDRYLGWAPEPPDELVVEVRDDPEYWAFVPVRDFLAPRLVTVIVPAREREVLIERTVVENRTVVFRDRGFAVNPGIPAAFVATSIGRPIHSFQVRPVVVAGTANLAGATVVRASELRQRRDVIARQSINIQQTSTVVQPARNVPPPQPLAANANGRLGNNPPRAARGATTGAAPLQAGPPAAEVRGPQRQQGTAPLPQTQPPAAQRPGQPPTTNGQAPTQQLDRGAEQRRPGARERGGATPQAPTIQAPGQRPGTTGAAPSPRDLNRGESRRSGAQEPSRATPQMPPSVQAPNRPGTTGAAPPEPRRNAAPPENRLTPPSPSRERAKPPAGARPQGPPTVRQEPRPQAPAARAPTPPPQAPRAPAAQAPRPQAPAAQAPRPQAPAAQAPRPQSPATTGAGPPGPRPQQERK